jgi:hypothetical protein
VEAQGEDSGSDEGAVEAQGGDSGSDDDAVEAPPAGDRMHAAQRMQQLLEQQQQVQGELSALLQQHEKDDGSKPAADAEQAWQLLQLAIDSKAQFTKQLQLLEDWLGGKELTLQLAQTIEEVQAMYSEYRYRRDSDWHLEAKGRGLGAAAEAQWQREWYSLQQQQQRLADAGLRLQLVTAASKLRFVQCGLEILNDDHRAARVDVQDVLSKARKVLDAKEAMLQQWGWQLQQQNAAFRPVTDDTAAAAAAGSQQDSSSSSAPAARLAAAAAAPAPEQRGSSKQTPAGVSHAMQRVQQLLTQQQQLAVELTRLLQSELLLFCDQPQHHPEPDTLAAVNEQKAWQLLQLAVRQKTHLDRQLGQLESWLGIGELADHLRTVVEDVQGLSGRQHWSLEYDYDDVYSCDADSKQHKEVGAAAEAQWVVDWRSLLQQQQKLAAAEPLLTAAVTAGSGTFIGGLECVWRATNRRKYDDEVYAERVSIADVVKKAHKALAIKEAALQRWGWRLQQHNPGFRPLDGDADSEDGEDEAELSSEEEYEEYEDAAYEDDAMQAGSSSGDDDDDGEGSDTAAAAAGRSAKQLLQFINGQAPESQEASAAAATATAAAQASAAQAGDAASSAAADAVDAAAAAAAAADSDDGYIEAPRISFSRLRRNSKARTVATAAAAAATSPSASPGGEPDAAADAEAAYASAYQAAFPAAFLDAFDAADEAAAGEESVGNADSALSSPFSSSSSSSSSEASGAADVAEAASAGSTVSSSSSSSGGEAVSNSSTSAGSTASSSSSELLDEMRTVLGLQVRPIQCMHATAATFTQLLAGPHSASCTVLINI